MTFLSNTYQREFEHIIQEIHTEATDTLVAKVIGKPQIPLLALALHYLFLKEQCYSPVQIRDYCTSTTLVQMGLDIHSEVSDEDGASHSDQVRLRQMQVLAGDLYSGKFYQILARRGDVHVIHFLSEAIGHINQSKTNFYGLLNKNQLTVKQYVQEIEKICSSLLKTWLENARTPKNSAWHDVVPSLLTAERLIYDLHHSELVTRQANMVTQLRHKVQQLVAQSRQLLHDWCCSDTKRELEHLIDVYFPGITDLGKTAEEC